MAVRAKFTVGSITEQMGYAYDPEAGKNVQRPVKSVKLHAVADGSEENKQFWAATPSGTIELQIANPTAIEQFAAQLGAAVYVDFTPAK